MGAHRRPADSRYAQSVLHQILAEQAADFGVVIDDQDVVGRVHGAILRGFRSGRARQR